MTLHVINGDKKVEPPKQKFGPVPIGHECTYDGDPMNYKWILHFDQDGLHGICANCGMRYTVKELLEDAQRMLGA